MSQNGPYPLRKGNEDEYEYIYLGLIRGLERSPGEGNGNPLPYSGLENPMDREPGRILSMGSQEPDMT